MHSHEDLLTAFSLSADLLLRSRLYAFAERKVLLKRNTLGEAVNRRSEKNALSEAASIFPLRLPLRGLKGASSPFPVPAPRKSGAFLVLFWHAKENLALMQERSAPRHKREVSPPPPEKTKAPALQAVRGPLSFRL